MAHIEHSDHFHRDLLAHRDQVQALLNRLDQHLSCADLLNAVQDCYGRLGKIRTELLIEHLNHHIAEEEDASKRHQAANELASLLNVNT